MSNSSVLGVKIVLKSSLSNQFQTLLCIQIKTRFINHFETKNQQKTLFLDIYL